MCKLSIISSSLNSGYYPCPLMSTDECNELLGGTEICLMGTRVSPYIATQKWSSHRQLFPP